MPGYCFPARCGLGGWCQQVDWAPVDPISTAEWEGTLGARAIFHIETPHPGYLADPHDFAHKAAGDILDHQATFGDHIV